MEYSADQLPFLKYDARFPILSEEGTPYFRVLLPELEEYEHAVVSADLQSCSVRVVVSNEDKCLDVVLQVSTLGVTPLYSDGAQHSETVWSERQGGQKPSVTVRPTGSTISKCLNLPSHVFGFHKALHLMQHGNTIHRVGVQPTRHLFILCKKVVYRSMDNPDLCFYYTPTVEDMLSLDWTLSQ